MTTTERLLDGSKDIWEMYNVHPFVLGIQNGDLDREKFRFYIVQDYVYLQDYARTFAVGTAKATNPRTAALFSKYVNMLNGEMDVHEGYLGKFNVTKEELYTTPAALDNLSYTSYMLRIAYEWGEAEVMAAILSCALSYEVIAKNMVKNNPHSADDGFYGDWVKGYISDRYSADNKELIDEMDRLGEKCTEEQLERLVKIFRTCSVYELKFWEMAWNMGK